MINKYFHASIVRLPQFQDVHAGENLKEVRVA